MRPAAAAVTEAAGLKKQTTVGEKKKTAAIKERRATGQSGEKFPCFDYCIFLL